MSELADETDSKSVIRTDVWVRAPPPAVSKTPENVEFINKIGDLFLLIFRLGGKVGATVFHKLSHLPIIREYAPP